MPRLASYPSIRVGGPSDFVPPSTATNICTRSKVEHSSASGPPLAALFRLKDASKSARTILFQPHGPCLASCKIPVTLRTMFRSVCLIDHMLAGTKCFSTLTMLQRRDDGSSMNVGITRPNEILAAVSKWQQVVGGHGHFSPQDTLRSLAPLLNPAPRCAERRSTKLPSQILFSLCSESQSQRLLTLEAWATLHGSCKSCGSVLIDDTRGKLLRHSRAAIFPKMLPLEWPSNYLRSGVVLSQWAGPIPSCLGIGHVNRQNHLGYSIFSPAFLFLLPPRTHN